LSSGASIVFDLIQFSRIEVFPFAFPFCMKAWPFVTFLPFLGAVAGIFFHRRHDIVAQAIEIVDGLVVGVDGGEPVSRR
jgi:hypothetical protein